jgi:hypothetical protein
MLLGDISSIGDAHILTFFLVLRADWTPILVLITTHLAGYPGINSLLAGG